MLVAIAAGFCAGVVTQLWWPVLPSLPGLALAMPAAGVFGLRSARVGWRIVAALAFGVAAGMALGAFEARGVIEARLPSGFEGRQFELEGDVGDLRVHGDGSVAFTLRVAHVPWRAASSTPGGSGLRLSSFDPLPVQDGERWRLVARLKRPHAVINPGGADFERIAFGDRILATGSVVASERNERRLTPRFLPALRTRLLAALPPLYGNGPGDVAADEATRFSRAVLPALLLDDRSLLTAEHWRVLGSTGTAHLVAISGLHVSLLWGAVLFLVAGLRRRWSPSRRYDAWSVLPALAAAVFYALAAGMPLPAERAVLMLVLASAFVLLSGELPGWRVLLLTTALVLARDPLAVHGAGFWLSHGAVAILVLIADLHRRRAHVPAWRTWVLDTARVQVVVTVLLVPPLLALFGNASISGVAANLPAGPLVNLVALPAGLLAILVAPLSMPTADILVDLACGALAWLWRWLAWIDGIRWLAPWHFEGAAAPLLLALGIALLLAIARPFRGALVVAAVLGLTAMPAAARLAPGVAEACVLDVGQGLAVLVRTRGHAILYDAGPGREDSDAGARTVVPAARALGVRRLDLLVLSDDDADHAGGAGSVLSSLRPREVVSGSRVLLRRHGRPEGLCRETRRWRFDDVEFLVLPGVDGAADRHDRACVLRVAAGAGAGTLLVPGDISAQRELDLVAAFRDALSADVLVATRHGSRVAGSATFMATVQPAHVVFASGYRNRFGYPHESALGTAEGQGATRWNTALDGAVCTRLGESARASVPVAARDASRRFWRDGTTARRAGEGRGLVVD